MKYQFAGVVKSLEVVGIPANEGCNTPPYVTLSGEGGFRALLSPVQAAELAQELIQGVVDGLGKCEALGAILIGSERVAARRGAGPF